jgi:hypothetical protein
VEEAARDMQEYMSSPYEPFDVDVSPTPTPPSRSAEPWPGIEREKRLVVVMERLNLAEYGIAPPRASARVGKAIDFAGGKRPPGRKAGPKAPVSGGKVPRVTLIECEFSNFMLLY